VAVCPEDGDPGALPGVEVRPVLRHRDRDWFPWETWEKEADGVAEAAAGFDVVWSFDRPLPARVGVPRLLTLGTLNYTRPLTALMGLHFEALAAPSAFLTGLARSIAGPGLWEGGAPVIAHVPNVVDVGRLRPVDPSELRRRLELAPRDRCLLFPHRPSMNKGLDTALAALSRLLETDGRFRLLVPREPGTHRGHVYAELQEMSRRAGLADRVLLHPWIGRADLAAYLSLGECSLTPSRLPEGFGFGPVEAVACGTPAVSTRCGALGDLLPPGHGVTWVPREDPGAVAAAVLAPPPPDQLRRGRERIAREYPAERAVEGYVALLARVGPRSGAYEPLRAREAAFSPLPG
jgi:glycosyltransferase involved in cell wall biosynthesis